MGCHLYSSPLPQILKCFTLLAHSPTGDTAPVVIVQLQQQQQTINKLTVNLEPAMEGVHFIRKIGFRCFQH